MTYKSVALLSVFYILKPAYLVAAFCDKFKKPLEYIDMKAKVDDKIKTFANKKAIAMKADETLSHLISAKSPILLSWMNKRNLDSKPEEEVVKEWRDYFARNFILIKYPQGSKDIDKAIEDLFSSVNQIFPTEDFKTKMETLFSKAKESSLKSISESPLSEAQKKQITNKIAAIHLYWTKDLKISKFKSLPLDFLDWGIAYDPTANEINMGINALAYPNDETYVSVFAHEIGHSFDSCRWSAFFSGPWPFSKIGDCLRKPSSVGAKKRDDSKLDLLVEKGLIPKALGQSLKENPTCNKLGYPPAGLQSDQLPESFADWFSAEAMTEEKDLNISDLRTDLCEKRDLNSGSTYPTNDERLNHIYFANPKLRALRKDLDTKITYCGWD